MKITKSEYIAMRDRAVLNFGKADYRMFFAPSRINIIGEHIDYNGGNVLPCAIEIGTYGLVKEASREVIRLRSQNAKLYKEVLIGSEYSEDNRWINYPLGMINKISEAGYKVGGIEGIIYGNIPTGAGLSSSASLEILIGHIINTFYNENGIKNEQLAVLGMKTENEFIGLNSGIMDQFAIAMGNEGSAILLNTETLDYEYVDAKLSDYVIVILNTNKGRRLVDSKYNERRAECESALKKLKTKFDIENLCDLKEEDLDEVNSILDDENERRRVRHAVTENARVNSAVNAIRKGDMIELGKLLNESHYSLKIDYEVTGEHLDAITLAARNSGAVGARMTGAGFGGCGIALVKRDQLEEFKTSTSAYYKKATGRDAEFYETVIGSGPRELEVDEWEY